MLIEGRTFIVSGGASGLGRETVARICRNGGYVSILDVNEEMGRDVVRGVARDRARFFHADVTKTESIASAVDQTMRWVRDTGKALAGVIAAAGIGNATKIIDKRGKPLDLGGFDLIMKVNVRGTIDLIRQVIPHLCASPAVPPDGERGVIVLVSSAAALEGQPGQVAYAASKGAIASLTLPLTRDLAEHGIRVVTIAPSLFDSAMTAGMPDRVRKSIQRAMEFPARPGQPEEFASLVQQSIENIMLNGVVIRLDGGVRMPSKL